MEDRPLVISHSHCQDGFTAAWVCHGVFGKKADYRFMRHDDPRPTTAEVANRLVIFTDFTFNDVESMRRIREEAAALVILDHHKTAGPMLEKLAGELPASVSHNVTATEDGSTCNSVLERMELDADGLVIRFHKDKCGSRLAWEYFHPAEASPKFLDYVEDRDLWKWDLPQSKEINASLSSYEFDFRQWDIFAEADLVDLEVEGRAINRFRDREIRSICQNAREVEFAGHRVLAVNSPCLISDVAGEVARGRPFGIAWFRRADGKVQVSLRVRDGEFDVGVLAEKHGGGGHARAAGFVTEDEIWR